jgi:hypothetical protein
MSIYALFRLDPAVDAVMVGCGRMPRGFSGRRLRNHANVSIPRQPPSMLTQPRFAQALELFGRFSSGAAGIPGLQFVLRDIICTAPLP